MSMDPAFMLSSEILERRISKFRAEIDGHGHSAAIILAAPARLVGSNRSAGNLRFFADWSSMQSPAALVIPTASKTAHLIVMGPHDARMASRRAPGCIEICMVRSAASMAEEIGRRIPGTAGVRGNAPCGAGFGEAPAALANAVIAVCGEPVAIDASIHRLRLERHEVEIARHRRAAEISDAMIATVMDLAGRQGTTPRDLMVAAEQIGRREGADQAGIWLATGGRPETTFMDAWELPDRLRRGDRVQLGTTLSFAGCFGQGLRTGFLGTPHDELERCIERLRAIQDAALAELAPGRTLHHLSDRLEGLIDEICPYPRSDDPFRFQSCHGLGLSYVEPGMEQALSPDRDRARDDEGPVVRQNMVVEIHPNFTLPSLGHVCIGDMALVGQDGAHWMTNAPRGTVAIGP